MIELFVEIPREKREQHKFFVDLALAANDLSKAAELLSSYTNSCQTEIEKEFIRFYIALKAEAANESNTDQR